MDFSACLNEHLILYPRMQAEDCLKLLYQFHCGSRHMLKDEKGAFLALKEELANVTYQPDLPLFVPVGDHISRLQLAAIEHPDAEMIHELAVGAARAFVPQMSAFMHDFKKLGRTITEYPVMFEQEDFDAAAAWFRGQAFTSIHHSDLFRQLYDPHYRIVYTRPAQTMLAGEWL